MELNHYFISLETRLILGAIAAVVFIGWCFWANRKMKKQTANRDRQQKELEEKIHKEIEKILDKSKKV